MALSVPDLANNSLPEAEREDASFLNWLCYSLKVYADRFEDALELFEQFAAERAAAMIEHSRLDTEIRGGRHGIPPEEWGPVAAAAQKALKAHRRCEVVARDAVLSVYHFGHAVRAVANNVGKTCPTLNPHIDAPALNSAVAMFDANFPRIDFVRNGVGHSAENHRDRGRAEWNAVKFGDGAFFGDYWGSVTTGGDSFVVTVAGKKKADGSPPTGTMAALRISRDRLAIIQEIQERVYRAFDAAVAFTNALPRPPKSGVAPP